MMITYFVRRVGRKLYCLGLSYAGRFDLMCTNDKKVSNGLFDNFTIIEYFCRGCGQLRLSISGYPKRCVSCGSTDLIKARPGVLDKAALKKENGF